MPVVWRTRALADVRRIIGYIAANNPVVAKRIGRELLLAGDSLVMFPRRGRAGRVPDTRELVAVRPHIIVDRVVGEDEVTILRIWHAPQERSGLG